MNCILYLCISFTRTFDFVVFFQECSQKVTYIYYESLNPNCVILWCIFFLALWNHIVAYHVCVIKDRKWLADDIISACIYMYVETLVEHNVYYWAQRKRFTFNIQISVESLFFNRRQQQQQWRDKHVRQSQKSQIRLSAFLKGRLLYEHSISPHVIKTLYRFW